MRSCAPTGMREGDLFAPLFKAGEKVLGVLRLVSQLRRENIGARIDEPEWFERGGGVIVQVLVEHGRESNRGVNQERVAIWRRPCSACRGNGPTRSGQIFDDDWLAELGRHFRRQGPGPGFGGV